MFSVCTGAKTHPRRSGGRHLITEQSGLGAIWACRDALCETETTVSLPQPTSGSLFLPDFTFKSWCPFTSTTYMLICLSFEPEDPDEIGTWCTQFSFCVYTHCGDSDLEEVLFVGGTNAESTGRTSIDIPAVIEKQNGAERIHWKIICTHIDSIVGLGECRLVMILNCWLCYQSLLAYPGVLLL